jgi:hypothetical protein
MEPSPIEDIHAAIESYNPFHTPAIVREQDIWEGAFLDVKTVNAHASDAVFQALEQVQRDKSGRNKITSMVITAQRGVGKSHTISRIHRYCQRDRKAMFVYAGVEKYAINSINYEFQQTLAESLDRPGSEGVSQWQELAAFMANQVYKAGNPHAQILTAKQLVTSLNKLTLEKICSWIELITEKFNLIYRNQRLDPDLVRAIFWTLSDFYSLYAIKWLAGKELSEKKSHELDLPNLSADLRNSEAKAFEHIRQILSLVSHYKPLIICFDELDIAESNRSQTGLAKPHLVANLIKTILDSINLPNNSHGVVILSVMMPDTWTQKIKQMPGGVPDRVSATKHPISLDFMDGNAIVELVKLWLADFYHQINLKPPTEIYPFEESFLRELADGNSVREILKACADKFAPHIPPKIHPVEPAYNKEFALLNNSRKIWLEDKTKIANSLFLYFWSLKGQTIDGFTINSLVKQVEPQAESKNYIDFKIVGNQQDKLVKIGVSVCQSSNSASLLALLNRLTNYKKFSLSRGCLVRTKKVSPGAKKTQECLKKFISELGGTWVNFKSEEIQPMLAILSVYIGREDYELSQDEIIDFIIQNKLASDSPIIRKILNEPTGKIPEILTDD